MGRGSGFHFLAQSVQKQTKKWLHEFVQVELGVGGFNSGVRGHVFGQTVPVCKYA